MTKLLKWTVILSTLIAAAYALFHAMDCIDEDCGSPSEN